MQCSWQGRIGGPALSLLLFSSGAHCQVLTQSSDEIRGKLNRAIEYLVSQNYREASPRVIERISAGERKGLPIKLESGTRSAVIASCGKDCSHIEIALYDFRHQLVARTHDQDDLVTINGKAQYDGLYEVEITVPGCHTSECEVGLLVMRQEPELKASTGANYNRYENRDLDGGDFDTLRNVDLQKCTSACIGDARCRAYSFDKWNRFCFLKNEIRSALRLDPRSVTGVREDIPTPAMATSGIIMERYRGKAFQGSGYKSTNVGQLEACEETCRTGDACVAYTFQKKERICHLFDTTVEYFANVNADSGGKAQESPVGSNQAAPAVRPATTTVDLSAAPTSSEPNRSQCARAIGVWFWVTVEVSIKTGGLAESSKGNGKWSCIDGKLNVFWDGANWVERFSISDDGKRLTGMWFTPRRLR
jgi:hypothetical protein